MWSTASDRIRDYPLDYLLRFLDHHGLIGVGRALPWRTIAGGSMAYVERIVDRIGPDAVRAGDPVVDVRRSGPMVDVRTAGGTLDAFDAVVMATHADDALTLLGDADPRERRALAGFEYTTNRVVLHTDERLLPRRPAARGSWNVDQADCRRPASELSMTYHMNRLQSLPGPVQWCVSVNPDDRLDPARIVAERADAPSDLHLRDARRPGGRVGAPGLATHVVRRRPPRLRLPRGRLSVRVRGGRDDRRRPRLEARAA